MKHAKQTNSTLKGSVIMNLATALIPYLKLAYEETALTRFAALLHPFGLYPLRLLEAGLLLYYKSAAVFFVMAPECLAFLQDESLEWLGEYIPNSAAEPYLLEILPGGKVWNLF